MRINWYGHTYAKPDGYGRMGVRMIRAMLNAGVNVTPVAREVFGWDGWLQRLSGVDFSRTTVGLCVPTEFYSIPGRLWGYTMTEADRVPDEWVTNINQNCERLILPAQWLIDVFQNSGVKKSMPVHIVPAGIDPNEFPVVDRSSLHRPFTFLALGDRGGRKGDDLVWMAFFKAFEGVKDVRLVIKCRATNHTQFDTSRTDRRVSVWREDIDSMADVFAQADCFVFPSRAEGWGLPPREAAATGMPVIAPRHSGLIAGLDNWAIPLESFTVSPALPIDNTGRAKWYVPTVDEVAEKMRWVYDHQDEARCKGLEAAAWLRANQTWEHAAEQMKALLELAL